MRRIGLLIMVAAVLAVMVLTASTAMAQEEERIEAKTPDTVAHPLICHAMAGKVESFAC